MASLTGNQINNTYQGLLKFTDNLGVGATPKDVTDGLGGGLPIAFASDRIVLTDTLDINNCTIDGTNETIGIEQNGANAILFSNDINGSPSTVQWFAGENITLNVTSPFDVEISATAGAPAASGRISSSGAYASTAEGPYTFFSNSLFFQPVFLQAGEVVDKVAMEIVTAFTTTTMEIAVYSTQVPDNVTVFGGLVPNTLLANFGTFNPSTSGVKELIGTTFTAPYTGIYFIGFSLIGIWDGSIRQCDSSFRIGNVDNGFLINGTDNDFTSAGAPIEYQKLSGTTFAASYPSNESYSSTSIRTRVLAYVQNNI